MLKQSGSVLQRFLYSRSYFAVNMIDKRIQLSFHSCTNSTFLAALHSKKDKYVCAALYYPTCSVKTPPRCYFHTAEQRSKFDSKPVTPKLKDIQVISVDGQTTKRMKRFEAEQIAQEQRLKLVSVRPANGETQKQPLYQLMTTQDYRAQVQQMKETKRLSKVPETKMLKLTAAIAEHDLNIKISHVLDWLRSGHLVKVVIVYSKHNTSTGNDTVFNQIVSACQELGTIKQAQKTATQMMFRLVPKSMSSSAVADSGQDVDCDIENTATNFVDKSQKPLAFREMKSLRDKSDAIPPLTKLT